jgi:hypothetical protein
MLLLPCVGGGGGGGVYLKVRKFSFNGTTLS